MLKVCIDTNVWISGLVFSGTPNEIIKIAMSRKRFNLIISDFILDEMERNLVRKFDVSLRTAKQLRYRISQIADVYEPKGTVKIVEDGHADNLVLETAWIGRAKYLVTGDREHLLPLKQFRRTKIIDPGSFYRIIKK